MDDSLLLRIHRLHFSVQVFFRRVKAEADKQKVVFCDEDVSPDRRLNSDLLALEHI